MRWILAVEYEYVRVYVYSIVLQAVIERRRKEKLHQVTKSRGEKVNAKTLMYCMTAYEPGSMGLCATGHFTPKQNYKVLKNNNIN